jgi:hypothetical protein
MGGGETELRCSKFEYTPTLSESPLLFGEMPSPSRRSNAFFVKTAAITAVKNVEFVRYLHGFTF